MAAQAPGGAKEALEYTGAALRIYEDLDSPLGEADALWEAALARSEKVGKFIGNR